MSNEDETVLARTAVMPADDNHAFSLPDVEIEEEIGRGGMGIVYKGRQTYIDRPVAIKVLKQQGGSSEFVARFQREAKILAQMHHPHIVACHQAGVSDRGECYLVMEYIDGMDLRKAIAEQGPLPIPALIRIGIEVSQALQHALQHDVIHRDVKPENILLQPWPDAPDGWPWKSKLADLGLARPQHRAGDNNLTGSGMVMGTPTTMAPEQIDDPDNVDFRADVYGLGCVLYQAATGKPAFSGKSLSSIIFAKTQGKIPNAKDERSDLSSDTSQIIMQLLAVSCEDRPASYPKLIESLRAVAPAADSKQVSRPSLKIFWVALSLVVALTIGMAVAGAMLEEPLINKPSDIAAPPRSSLPPPDSLPRLADQKTIPEVEIAVDLNAGVDLDLPPVMGKAQPIFGGDFGQRLAGWATYPDSASWNEQGDGEQVFGVAGQLFQQNPAPHWQLNTLIRSESGSIDELAIGARFEDQSMIAVTVRNIGIMLVDVQTIDAKGNQLAGHLDAPVQIDAEQMAQARFTIAHIGNELRLQLGELLDLTLEVSERSAPAYWVNNRDPRNILAIPPGSSLAESLTQGGE